MSAAEVDAIIAAINAGFSTPRAMGPKAAKSATSDHIIVYVSRRYVPDQLLTGEVTDPGGRIVTRHVAKTMDNYYVLQKATRAALEDQRLDVAGQTLGPIVFETEDPVEEDDGWWSGADSWTY